MRTLHGGRRSGVLFGEGRRLVFLLAEIGQLLAPAFTSAHRRKRKGRAGLTRRWIEEGPCPLARESSLHPSIQFSGSSTAFPMGRASFYVAG